MSWYNSSANNFVISWADSPSDRSYNNTSVSKKSNVETETKPKAPKQQKRNVTEKKVIKPKKRKTDPNICTPEQKRKRKVTKDNFF